VRRPRGAIAQRADEFPCSLIGNAYSVVVYLQPGKNAMRLLRLSQMDIERGQGPAIELVTLRKAGKGSRKAGATKAKKAPATTSASTKRKRAAVELEPEPEDGGEAFFFDEDNDEGDGDLPSVGGCPPGEDEDDEGAGWEDVTLPKPAATSLPKAKRVKAMMPIELSD
jgi:hypothetical protein